MIKKIILPSLIMLAAFSGCVNKDRDFPDFDYSTVYFSYQYPVRTITLGEDPTVNNELDNQHKFKILASLGGVYEARNDVNIGFTIDNSLLGSGMLFKAGGDEIMPLPASYYHVAANTMRVPKGALSGGVEIQLSDAFFNDPKAIKNTYVLPVKITSVSGADSIVLGKDYTLYAVKFVNQWHGNYLRRGVDAMTGSVNKTVTRHGQYVEYDEVNKLSTRSFTELEFPVVFKDSENRNFTCTLLLKFDNSGNCTISTATPGFNATGSGAFVKKGEKKSWGDKDRDALYLNYQINYSNVTVGSSAITGSISTKDTLVMRDRSVVMETYSPVNK